MTQAAGRERMRQYQEYLRVELEAAALYKALADRCPSPERARVWNDLAASELRQARRWAERLGQTPPETPPSRLSWKVRVFLIAGGVLGVRRLLPFLLRGEANEIRAYSRDPEAQDMVREEQRQTGLLKRLAPSSQYGKIAAFDTQHLITGGAIRAGVMGINDGLVSNFGLVMGVAGANVGSEFVLLTGVAGLLAGAFSMAAGEYISVRSQRDLYENQIRIEQSDLEESPEDEEGELALIYEAKGLSKADAAHVARHLISKPEVALDALVKEKLGITPESLGSPWSAAISSFVAFGIGAIVPIIPFIFQGSSRVLAGISGAASGFALLLVGGALAYFSGRNVPLGAVRMFLIGAVAAGITYGAGSLIGTVIN